MRSSAISIHTKSNMLTESFISRSELLLGAESVSKLERSHVLIVGLGGVGGFAAELLCRAGIGCMTIVDGDVVSPSNINRQIIALNSTVGKQKAELFASRFVDINPNCKVNVVNSFLKDEAMVSLLNADKYDYIVDAIDTLSPKVFLLYHATKLGIPIVSAMGSGGKLDPTQVHISDVEKSHTCPLASSVRKRLHKLGVEKGFKVVFSTEKPIDSAVVDNPSQNKRTTLGVISYMPAVFGSFCASVVINDLLKCVAN